MPDTMQPETSQATPAPVAQTNGAWLKKWGPLIIGSIAVLGFIWNSWIEPRLAISFVSAEKGAAMSTRIKSNETKSQKLELRIQRVEDAVVSTKEVLVDIRDSVNDLRRRKR